LITGRTAPHHLGNVMAALLNLVHEDDEILVVNKPADLVCHPTKQGALSSLIGRARRHCGEARRPQLINRLDRETSGLVLLTKNALAARELRALWEGRAVDKTYLSIVHGHVRDNHFVIDAPLGRDDQSLVAIKNCVRPDGRPAQTEARVLRRFERSEGAFSLIEAKPLTGRKHQIRIHLAHRGHPVVGDKIYGGDETLYLDFVAGRLTAERRNRLLLPCHALHAERLAFRWRGTEHDYRAPPEGWFEGFLC
jgi:23S rRNA pseudouridine1911/1915/1917 synthase